MIAIRPACVDDLEKVVAAHVEADFQTYAPIFGARTVRRSEAAARERWGSALGDDDVFFVAERGGRLVGFAHAGGDWLSALYLLVEARRLGVGGRLLTEVRRACAARGIAMLRFQCVEANSGAIAFYLRQGARVVGRKREGEGEDAWDDLLLEVETGRADGEAEPPAQAPKRRAARGAK